MDAVGAVELKLRDVDGTAPGPFLFLDRLRQSTPLLRRGVTTTRPYISNLCVSSRCRRRGIASALLSAAEFVAGSVWGECCLVGPSLIARAGYDTVFLHVHENNKPALGLYRHAGYLPISLSHVAAAAAAPSLIYHYKPLAAQAPSVASIEQHLHNYYAPLENANQQAAGQQQQTAVFTDASRRGP